MEAEEMPSKHTPEPWWFSAMEGPLGKATRLLSRERVIALHVRPIDAKRIITCVNACEGINPEAVPELLEAAKYLIGCAKAEAWRDRPELQAARAAIARTEAE